MTAATSGATISAPPPKYLSQDTDTHNITADDISDKTSTGVASAGNVKHRAASLRLLLSRFDTMLERDRQTDRQTVSVSHVSIPELTRDKNRKIGRAPHWVTEPPSITV